jgi:hypothetical protein
VVGIPEVGFLEYAYTARKPHSENPCQLNRSMQHHVTS